MRNLNVPQKLVCQIQIDCVRVVFVVFLQIDSLVVALGTSICLFDGVANELLDVGPKTLLIGTDQLGPQNSVAMEIVHVAVLWVDVVGKNFTGAHDVALGLVFSVVKVFEVVHEGVFEDFVLLLLGVFIGLST